ncbi:hypothetical protein RLQ69_001905 [Campylobacter jejuni]|uniref:Phage protein, HK97 gp10 family n=1 Tax=Campylobacter jejuni TaxID=197 RepID=A0A690V062_CAMJU|nr:hypothetical protein [Campylobacter jejuni]EAJ5194563.1 hypothetical protein [Campylobacter jejuni]EAK0574291.1 hypothetical protein [Campylobacter jejuni]EDP7703096.1 hypothetical protein [Campylobacter jejuni]EDP8235145.1 hypothetical protein [Campylobacter jejuni]EFV4333213.1 hypothetical protein [Campylobacter jejuni]
MIEVKGLNELMKDLQSINKKALPNAAKKGALEVAKEITNDYKKNIPKQSGLLKQSVKAVSSYTLEKGVYRAASVVFRMKKVGIKRFEKLKNAKKWTQAKKNERKQRMDYFASAYYAHFIEYGFFYKGGVKKSEKGNTSGKTTYVKGTYTMQKAKEKIDPKMQSLVTTKLNAELDKLGF